MGGNALTVPTMRLTRAGYEVVSRVVLDDLRAAFGLSAGTSRVIEAYRGKETFGDLDVLVGKEAFEGGGGPGALRDFASRMWGSRSCYFNSDVRSVEVNLDFLLANRGLSEDDRVVLMRELAGQPVGESWGFQADVIGVAQADLAFATGYFSFNDLGNLVGRVAHAMGMKFGHDGLQVLLRDGDHHFETLVLTKNFEEALSFLGYDVERFRRGFEGLEEIFLFASSTKYFNKDLYALDNRNYASRVRDRKRPTYTAFLKWVEEAKGVKEYPHERRMVEGGDSDFKSSRPIRWDLLDVAFPAVVGERERAFAFLEVQKEAGRRMSVERLEALGGVLPRNKALGGLMTRLKVRVGMLRGLEWDGVESERSWLSRNKVGVAYAMASVEEGELRELLRELVPMYAG